MRSLLSACSIALLVAMPVAAKPLSRILADMGLTTEDFDLMGSYAETLYRDRTPQPGAKASWSNEHSGAHGSVTVQEFKNSCVVLRHEATAGGKDKPVLITTRRCRNADGVWVLQP